MRCRIELLRASGAPARTAQQNLVAAERGLGGRRGGEMPAAPSVAGCRRARPSSRRPRRWRWNSVDLLRGMPWVKREVVGFQPSAIERLRQRWSPIWRWRVELLRAADAVGGVHERKRHDCSAPRSAQEVGARPRGRRRGRARTIRPVTENCRRARPTLPARAAASTAWRVEERASFGAQRGRPMPAAQLVAHRHG